VAHRGYALRYPENTIESLRAALAAGACYVEFDVQLCADGVPVLLHDASLQRTADVDESALQLPLSRLREIEVNERRRLGDRFRGVRIPTLGQAIELIRSAPPSRQAFVEIKRESIEAFGVDAVVEAVLDAVAPAAQRCVLISFDAAAVERARGLGSTRIGWVLAEWCEAARRQAEALSPDFLFCDRELLPSGVGLWSGPWSWAVYEVIDPAEALALGERGVELIETMAIREMLADPRLAVAACTD